MTKLLTLSSLVLPLLLATSPLMAQDQPTTEIDVDGDKDVERPNESSASRSSADNRAEKKFGVGVGAGLFLVPAAGGSLNLTYNMNSNLQFELGSWSGDFDAEDTLDDPSALTVIDRFDVDATMTTAKARYFFSNSFYLAGGLGYRTIDFDLYAVSGASSISAKIDTQSTIALVSIGNIWTFDSGFYIGGEWLAIHAPLSSSSGYSIKTQGATNSDLVELERDAKDVANDLSEAVTAGIATLQIGWQF